MTGTPTTAGTFSFTARVTDSASSTATQAFSIGISASSSPSPLFVEDFSGTLANWTIVDEGTINAPSAWSVLGGQMVQSSNIYGGSTDGTDPVKPGSFALAGNTSWADYEFNVSLMGQDDDGIGVMFRYQNPQNYYRFSMDSQRAYRRLTKTVGGVTTILAQDSVAYTLNQWSAVKITAVGSQIQVSVNGVLLFNVTDSSIASGKIGLYVWGEQGAYFDDVSVNQK